MDTRNPPRDLIESATRIVEDGYFTWRGCDAEVATEKTYDLIVPGVAVYYQFGPETKHPSHAPGEYGVSVYKSRWHATVYPYRRAELDGRIYEVWIVHYSGQGMWYNKLAKYKRYLATVADDRYAQREIIRQSERVPGELTDQVPEESGQPPWASSLDLPSGKVVRLLRIGASSERSEEAVEVGSSAPAYTAEQERDHH